jgi:hypothetical protein
MAVGKFQPSDPDIEVAMPTALDIALGYIERGWNPVPIPYRTKRPLDDSWQTRIIDAETAPRYFNGELQNIGIILGPTSHGLTDIDLDCPEAIAIAPYVLPRTGAIFGRASKRASHWLYATDLAVAAEKSAVRYKDPKSKGTILELRTGGDSGAQTVFPGSMHESGEIVSWEEDGEPAAVDGDDLHRRVRAIAAYALLARYWPQPGSGGGHDAGLVIGGFLARAGRTTIAIKNVAEAIAKAAGDPRWRNRREAAEDAAIAYREGKKAFGLNALRETFSTEVADKIAEWLGYRGGNNAAPEDDEVGGEQTHRTNNAFGSLQSARASTYEMTAIQWIWPGRFAVGKLGIIAGLPDEGKGQIFCDIAARITGRDNKWPCGEGHAPQGNVILLTAEDDISDTVVPRLVAAGADLSRVEIVRMVREPNQDRMFSLITDLNLLRQKIIEVGDVRAVLIDPISAYLGVKKMDSFRTTDVRAVLGPVTELTTEMKVLILGIMHFNKKIDVTNALLRISDSLAFGATARHVYAVVDDAENKRKLFVKGKNNLAPKDAKALAYDFGTSEVGTDKQTGEIIRAPHIIWHPQHVDVTATEAMQATNETKSPAARDDAKKFLADLLARGPVPKTEIEEAAEANCISERTLWRAKSELHVMAKKDAQNGGWTWRLPPNAKPHWSERGSE